MVTCRCCGWVVRLHYCRRCLSPPARCCRTPARGAPAQTPLLCTLLQALLLLCLVALGNLSEARLFNQHGKPLKRTVGKRRRGTDGRAVSELTCVG